MGVVYACALSFMSKYLYQYCGPKPMTRADINDNNQSSNKRVLFMAVEDSDKEDSEEEYEEEKFDYR
jgi:hypothetical protein